VLRAGEIRGLQWGDVVGGQLTVRRALDNETNEVIASKHNKARTVPMSPRTGSARDGHRDAAGTVRVRRRRIASARSAREGRDRKATALPASWRT
jgi:integrase